MKQRASQSRILLRRTMCVIVTGIPGVGKSAILSTVSAESGIEVMAFGSEMLELARKRSLVASRDDLRRLDPRSLQELHLAVAEVFRPRNCIVDAHAVVNCGSCYVPALRIEVIEHLRPAALILVEASTREIWSRRARQTGRNRLIEERDAISVHQDLNRSFTTSIAATVGCLLVRVVNSDDLFRQSVDRIVRVLKMLQYIC